MPEVVVASLKAHEAAQAVTPAKGAQAVTRLKAGARWHEYGLVFPGPAGLLSSPRGVRDGFRRRCERAGIGGDWHPHEMRHTWVSVLKDAGLDIEAIAAAAGHEKLRRDETDLPARDRTGDHDRRNRDGRHLRAIF